MSNIVFSKYDLEKSIDTDSIAIDAETMGLKIHRDRLCLLQIADKDSNVYLVHFPKPIFDNSPNLIKLLSNPNIKKIFHFARFDLAALMHSFKIQIQNIYCTKVASKIARTYTDKHGLKELCRVFLNINISKDEQTSDWGSENLSSKQHHYAANDVIYLHKIKEKLDALLQRENRMHIADGCFNFLPHRAFLDLVAGEEYDVFAHI